MKNKVEFCELSQDDFAEIIPLAQQLNPKLSEVELKDFLFQMFGFSNYYCFGLRENGSLIALSSGWITVRFYSGKQLEVDNVIVDQKIQLLNLEDFFKIILKVANKKNKIVRKTTVNPLRKIKK